VLSIEHVEASEGAIANWASFFLEIRRYAMRIPRSLGLNQAIVANFFIMAEINPYLDQAEKQKTASKDLKARFSANNSSRRRGLFAVFAKVIQPHAGTSGM